MPHLHPRRPEQPGRAWVGCTRDTTVLRYNDTAAALADLFAAKGDKIAGVILEPVVGNMGLVPPSAEFRRALRDLTQKHGALLIYDEVMTGFRLGYGGAQMMLGDMPDITCFGKIIGGGYPVGAYGGRADIMKKVMPAGPVFQAGTLSGNPVAMAAGIATLSELKANPPYDRLEEQSGRIGAGLLKAAAGAGVPVQFNRVGSMWTLFFTNAPVTDLDTAKTSDTARFGRFFWEMMDRGVYLPCSQYEAAFTCAAMTDEHIAQTIQAVYGEPIQEPSSTTMTDFFPNAHRTSSRTRFFPLRGTRPRSRPNSRPFGDSGMKARTLILVLGLTAVLGIGGYAAWKSPWLRSFFARDSEDAAEPRPRREGGVLPNDKAARRFQRAVRRSGGGVAKGALRLPGSLSVPTGIKTPPKVLWREPIGGGTKSCSVVGGKLRMRRTGWATKNALCASTPRQVGWNGNTGTMPVWRSTRN